MRLDQIRLDWIRLDQIGFDWIGLDWIGQHEIKCYRKIFIMNYFYDTQNVLSMKKLLLQK